MSFLEVDYTIEGLIDEGFYSQVFAGRRNRDDLPVVLKSVKNPRTQFITTVNDDDDSDSGGGGTTTSSRRRSIPQEVYFMQELRDVPGVIRILEYHIFPNSYLIIMERFENSLDLQTLVRDNYVMMPENVCKNLFKQIVTSVVECRRRKGVYYGDVKLENVIVNLDDQSTWLIDFGKSERYHPNSFAIYRGEFRYVPPELLQHGQYYADPATIWSLGVLLYEMLHKGNEPFPDVEAIMNGEMKRPLRPFLSRSCEDILLRCLTLESENRIRMDHILDHPWLN